MTTNYTRTFISVSPDCPAIQGMVPGKPDSAAGLQHELLIARPYHWTSDELLFEVHCRRNGVDPANRESERRGFFAKPKACLRASPLVKQFGWGLHFDEAGAVAAVALGTADYDRFLQRKGLKVLTGMRNRRA